MYKIKALDVKYEHLWDLYRAKFFNEAERFHLDSYIEEAHSSAKEHGNILLTNHIFLLDRMCECFLLLASSLGEKPVNQQQGAFLSQLHRDNNYLLSIKQLLTTGFEDACRPLTRSFIESLDLSMACFVSTEFAAKIFGDKEIDYDKLWAAEIGYGKIIRYVKMMYEAAAIPSEEIEEIIEYRKVIKNTLSSTVHGDGPGAFRSWAPPVLGYPGMLSTAPHGY